MALIAILLLVIYLGFFLYIANEVLRCRFDAVLLYTVIFFPIYALFLTFNYEVFESKLMVNLIQYSKEVIVFGALGLWFLGQKDLLHRSWKVSLLDSLFVFFIGLAFLFFVLGTGEATFVNKAVYLKNILLIGIFYFLGRQVKIKPEKWKVIFNAIFVLTILACALVTIEKLFGQHFHTYVGYAKYHFELKDTEPAGAYGLNWTFEAEGGKPRYASFFANPLELSSSMLITVALTIIYMLSVRYNVNKKKYLIVLLCAFISVVFAYSRASFVSFFLMLVFIAFLMRYYQLLASALVAAVLVALYIAFVASNEILFFVLDTITFENSSSVTHVIDWLNAVESMLAEPMGIGLAMSGNAGGVEKDLIVGGENQYLIYGVQMGFIGMFLYLGMLGFGIRNSWRAFRMCSSREEAVVPFAAAAVKFGLLLPLFTANAEAYIYVSLVSWWFIGHSETMYQDMKARVKTQKLLNQKMDFA